MSADKPTPDDIRTIAQNMRSEGENSRAEVLINAAMRLEDYMEMYGRRAAFLAAQAATIIQLANHLTWACNRIDRSPLAQPGSRNEAIVKEIREYVASITGEKVTVK